MVLWLNRSWERVMLCALSLLTWINIEYPPRAISFVMEVRMVHSRVFRLGVRVAALALIIAPLVATGADARGGGGGGGSHGGGGGGGFSHGGGGGGGFSHGGGGGFSRGGGGGFGGIGRSAPMMHSAPMIRSAPTMRSFSGSHSVPRSITSSGITSRHISRSAGVTSGNTLRSSRISSGPTVRSGQARQQTVAGQTQLNRQVTNRNQVNRNQVTRTVQGVGRAKALRNNAFASSSTRSAANRALARSTFHGRFAGQNWHSHSGWNWRHRNPIIVIGWGGALFWPYAYWDFIDYTFWPYAYDAFWPYAYDDFYVGMFGPYAYEGPAYKRAGFITRPRPCDRKLEQRRV